jgi:SNF2 family DNA or RNA helicase
MTLGQHCSDLQVVIFSQFTKFLDLLGPALEREGVAFTRLDGKTSREKRGQAIRTFQESDDVNCFLISLKVHPSPLSLPLSPA